MASLDQLQSPEFKMPAAGGLLMTPEMSSEISNCQFNGINVNIAETYDRISDTSPENVQNVNTILLSIQGDFDLFKAHLSEKNLDRNTFEMELEAFRERVMFGKPLYGMAWHEQRGTAIALQTIQEAGPDLNRMSGSIGEEVLDQTIEGLSLKTRLVESFIEMYKGNITLIDAEKLADRRIAKTFDFINTPVTESFRMVAEYCADSCGIRARAQIVEQEGVNHVLRMAAEGTLPNNPRLVSLGCGNGKPIFNVANRLIQYGINPIVELIDQDPMALAFAQQIGQNLGIQNNVKVHCMSIFKGTQPLNLSRILGSKSPEDAPVLIEDSGLREYLPNKFNLALNKEVMRTLSIDGLSLSGNMNDKRFNSAYLHGAMGWSPKVRMRSIPEMVAIYLQAGIPVEALNVSVTKDGLYSMYMTKKER